LHFAHTQANIRQMNLAPLFIVIVASAQPSCEKLTATARS
jgi:hypothetical protein